ncbi:lysophospholipid acyltransferase family protein [Microbacterium excoecariae]|uniref:lysophospholipid acyltransferase family protein n=1 Tax=Microbacterium excoecariae TaxID=2715210 RepID=UPI001F0F6166|nr:lysophospholipid acyltransferase family protein [Microbacterium excoecariae]NHI17234.1 1-acyl-sn-glycerol-3-phosphate acyltransferase [Microbacterium excoecariae]
MSVAQASREKSRPSIFWPLAAVIVPVVGALARIEIRGAENLPREGAYVLAPNHHSEIDPLTVAVAVWKMGRAPRFMAKESLFRVPVLGSALRATGMVPVARSGRGPGGASQSIEQARGLVERASGVIVYPEGTLTRDPDLWPMRGKSGAARLALAGDIPVIPLAHWGEQQIMPRYGRLRLFPPRRRITVVVGEPVDLSDLVGREHERGVLTEATSRIMGDIARLLGGIRGEQPPAELWDPAKNGQAETGRL